MVTSGSCHGEHAHDTLIQRKFLFNMHFSCAAFQNFTKRHPALVCLLAQSHSSSSIYYSFMEITNELWEEREKRFFWNALISCQQALQTELRNFDRMDILFSFFSSSCLLKMKHMKIHSFIENHSAIKSAHYRVSMDVITCIIYLGGVCN